MIEEILRENGLSEKETAIYLAALEMGEATVARIAMRAHLKRTTVYSMLSEMKRRGLLAEARRHGIVYISALPPQVLIDRFKRAARLAEDMLPQLSAIASDAPLKARLRIYDGLEGIKNVLLEFGDSSVPTMGFTDYESMPQELRSFVRSEVVPLRRKRGNPVRLLAPKNATNQKVQADDLRNFGEHRLLDFPSENMLLELLLFEGRKIAFLSFSPSEYFAAVIDSDAAYRMLKGIFELLWNTSGKKISL